MSVTLAKETDGNATRTRRPELNYGTGQLQFIAGFPTARLLPRPARKACRNGYVTGGRVRVSGLRIDARPVAFLDIAGRGGTAWIMRDGTRVAVEGTRTVGDWFRFLLDTGTFAGIVFLR